MSSQPSQPLSPSVEAFLAVLTYQVTLNLIYPAQLQGLELTILRPVGNLLPA